MEKVEYTAAEKAHARIVLGFRDPSGVAKDLADRSHESLIQLIRNLQDRDQDRIAAHQAALKAMEDRLRSARKAKQLANRRADVAVKAMKDMLDTFKEVKND